MIKFNPYYDFISKIKMKDKESKLKKYFLNKKYMWLGGLFLIWMSFFDTNSFLTHLNLGQTKRKVIKNISLLSFQVEKEKKILEKIPPKDKATHCSDKCSGYVNLSRSSLQSLRTKLNV